MKQAVIVSAVRTPIGSFGGALAPLSAVDLGTQAAKDAIRRAGIDPVIIDEVLVGNILSAGQGQNVARQVAIHAGVPDHVPAMTINKLCGSGLRTVSVAAQFIALGDAKVVLAGGTESMSNAPYIMKKARWGMKMGNGSIEDTMMVDGLMDAFQDYHMGITAENIAEKWDLTRLEQDTFAAKSQQKAQEALANKRFSDEIVPVTISSRKGEITIDLDEYPRAGTTVESLSKLRPAFKKEGTVTAGNASGINDGAAFVIVMEKAYALEIGAPILCEIKSYGHAALDPAYMGYGPVPATKKALERVDMTMADIDLIEANEAFAAQSLAVVKDLKIPSDKVNVNGGAIALGHPIGASGTRILVTLIHEMIKREAKTGLATLCIGGGQGAALIVERNETDK